MNCTISGNKAAYYGGIFSGTYYSYDTDVTFTNCIIRNNVDTYAGAYDNVYKDLTVLQTFTNCDVQGSGSWHASTPPSNYYFSTKSNMLDSNPLFTTALDPATAPSTAGNFHIQQGNPCIGAGTASGAPPTDFEGETRANPPSIGAYEGSGNAAPSAATVTGTQQTSGAHQGNVLITYTLTDADGNNCNLNTAAAQIQYSASPYSSWNDASAASGSTVTGLTASAGGTAHTADLWRNCNADLGSGVSGNYKIRIKSHDDTEYAADYAASDAFDVDTVKPDS